MRSFTQVTIACAVFITIGSSSARAQEPDDEVQSILASAISEYDGHNYEEAYALFLRVHAARPSARSARALGNTAFELRHYVECLRWYGQALADDRNPLTPDMRAEVMGLVARARAFVGTFTLSSNVEGVRLSIDGVAVDGTASTLDIGDHEIRAEAPGHDETVRRVTVHGGEQENVELLLHPSVPRVAPQDGPRDAAPDPGNPLRDFGWASITAGGALTAGGLVGTIIWASTVNTLNANVEAGACSVDPMTESVTSSVPECLDQQSRYRLAGTLAVAGYAAGAVFLGTGIGLVLGESANADGPSQTALACGPFAEGGLVCGGAF